VDRKKKSHLHFEIKDTSSRATSLAASDKAHSTVAFFPHPALPFVRKGGVAGGPHRQSWRGLGVSMAPPRAGLDTDHPLDTSKTRRAVLWGMGGAVAGNALGSTWPWASNAVAENSALSAVPDVEGVLKWAAKDDLSPVLETELKAVYGAEFATYLARFLLNYDLECSAWWNERLKEIPSNLPPAERAARRTANFAAFAATVEYGLRRYLGKDGPLLLLKSLDKQHGDDREACRHLALAFSFLDPKVQPVDGITSLVNRVQRLNLKPSGGDVSVVLPPMFSPVLPDYLSQDFRRLLPTTQVPIQDDQGFYYVRGLSSVVEKRSKENQRFGRASYSVFGPLGEQIKRERTLGPIDFALFSLAGAIGCSATHSAVIPLDVVKTRLQTEPGKYKSIRDGFSTISKTEGLGGLFLGAAPTLLGYVYYGATVYPGFEFFERSISMQVGLANAAAFRAPVVLLSGACATVAACFGVCPAEVLRIRMVSKPAQYGNGTDLLAAVAALSAEAQAVNTSLLRLLYTGFQPILVRQVIFGMIKFFTFDSCVDAILNAFPTLAESTQSELLVSFGAGLVAGVVSSLVSQPADTVLSRMNRGSDGASDSANETLGVLDAVRVILEEYGPAGLFLGAGTRCVWSGAIISGQFFFYDLARQFLKVTPNDLALLLDVQL